MANIVQAGITQAVPKLRTALKYIVAEMKPPTPGEFSQVRSGFQNLIAAYRNKSWKQTPVRQAWLNTMVTLEVICWFYVGEVIGRRNLYGYSIPAE